MKKISKLLLGALLSASLVGSVIAAEETISSSSATKGSINKAGDSVVTLVNKCSHKMYIDYIFQFKSHISGTDLYYYNDKGYYSIRYPDQLVCFSGDVHDECFSSGDYEIRCAPNGKAEIKKVNS